jgi:hypothetical protein
LVSDIADSPHVWENQSVSQCFLLMRHARARASYLYGRR